jgi:hypothetical protein
LETQRRRSSWWPPWWILLALIVAGCYESLSDLESGSGNRSSPYSLDTWWSSLTQQQRNQAVVSRAVQQVGQVTGQQCKEWVRSVVSGASSGSVLLPPNQSNGWQWHTSAHVRLLGHNVCPANLAPGHVVQMVQASGLPHTAIVQSVGYSGMTWLDANWVNYNHPVGTVASHAITWAQFYGFAAHYSFYEIIG